ncbi:hypothetical protein K8I31_02515, partial [bacterium]|nr:hypothetical protein [bacterium]
SQGGSLGDSASTDPAVTANLLQAAGGEDQMGLVIDLAAQTRTVRVSTIDRRGTLADATDDIADGKVDEDYTDGGGITGFISNADPFATNLQDTFTIGNTDYEGNFDATGDPTASPPTGIDDSGVQLVALSSGVMPTTDDLTTENFDGFQAFDPEVTAFRSIFNQRGYGVAANFDDTTGIDRTAGVPVGIVARSTDTSAFETNTLLKDGLTRNTVNYQAVVPSDNRTLPNQTTGELIFDPSGRFDTYGDSSLTPNITFDPDNSDPANGGVDPIAFRLDLSGITYFSANSTAQLQSQDGRPVGNLDNISIAGNGEIIGVFTNGDSQTLGQILLADVTNDGGLIQEGATLFTVGPNSGERVFIEPEVEG